MYRYYNLDVPFYHHSIKKVRIDHNQCSILTIYQVVRVTGVEPARITPLDPKSSASANFATPAQKELYPIFFVESILFKNYHLFFFFMIKTITPSAKNAPDPII